METWESGEKGRKGEGERERKGEEEKERKGEGERGREREGEGEDQLSSVSSRERSGGVDSSKRLGPWHPPDYNRQRALADRLSNPSLRSGYRPRSRISADENPYPSTNRPYSSPNQRPRTTGDYSNQKPRTTNTPGSRMSSAASSSSPRRGDSSPRRQMSTPRDGGSSPRRQLTTPRYGSASPRRQPPLFPNSANSRRVTDEELDSIVGRVTRPTVSSRGGVDLLDKDFTYIQPKRLKTLPVVPGLERRYMGLQSVDQSKMDDIVYRLTRMTSAYSAKFAINKNVWVDREPGAHMVQRGNPQSV